MTPLVGSISIVAELLCQGVVLLLGSFILIHHGQTTAEQREGALPRLPEDDISDLCVPATMFGGTSTIVVLAVGKTRMQSEHDVEVGSEVGPTIDDHGESDTSAKVGQIGEHTFVFISERKFGAMPRPPNPRLTSDLVPVGVLLLTASTSMTPPTSPMGAGWRGDWG